MIELNLSQSTGKVLLWEHGQSTGWFTAVHQPQAGAAVKGQQLLICLTVQLSGENKVMLKESREKASEVRKKNEKINSLHDITNAPDLQSELKLWSRC